MPGTHDVLARLQKNTHSLKPDHPLQLFFNTEAIFLPETQTVVTYRDIVYCHFFQDMSPAQIAKTYSMTIGDVHRILRGIQNTLLVRVLK